MLEICRDWMSDKFMHIKKISLQNRLLSKTGIQPHMRVWFSSCQSQLRLSDNFGLGLWQLRENYITTWHSFTPREREYDKSLIALDYAMKVDGGEPCLAYFRILGTWPLTSNLAFASVMNSDEPKHRMLIHHATMLSCCQLSHSCNLQPSDGTTVRELSYLVFHPSARKSKHQVLMPNESVLSYVCINS